MNYKKNILFIEGILSIIILGLVTIDNVTRRGLCDYNIISGLKYFRCATEPFLQIISFFVLMVFIFLLPLYFLKEGVYLSWRKFALWYIPITLLITVVSSTTSQGGSFSGMMPSDREFASYFFPIVFALISLILIIYKSVKLRGK